MSWSFDGVDDYLAAGTETLGTIFTITAWIKPIDLGEAGGGLIFAQGGGGSPRVSFGLFNTPANSFRLFCNRGTDGEWVSLLNTVVLNQWQQLAAAGDLTGSGNPKFYVNGQPVTATVVSAPSGTWNPDNQIMYLGNTATGVRTFHGLIGEVVIWPRDLPAVEMQNQYILGPAAYPDYGWYWPGDPVSPLQQFPRGGQSLTAVAGVLAGENPPARPAGRRG